MGKSSIYFILIDNIVNISLNGSVAISKDHIEWSLSTNFNKIQDGACHASQAVFRT